MNQPWQTVTRPEDAGLSSRGLLEYLNAVEKSGLEHHSIMILRHGKLALTLNWKPYDIHAPHMLFSLSKSFCSAAAGFAVAEGLLSWDSKVIDVLKEDVPENPSEWLQSVTLSHLLMMGSGLKEESDSTETVAQTLAYDCDHEPGTWFHYNSHGTMLVSAMVQKVSGMTIRDYLIPRLFAPLGIATPEWDKNPEGICWGGWGLHLNTEDILRFGLCLLNHGKWQGKQVLPEGWVELASRKHIDNSNGHPDPNNEWNQGYGYQFWRTRGNRYRGDGAFGQICMISEEQDMVVAVTAGTNDMGKEMDLMHRYLFPAADMEPGTPEEQAELLRRAEALAYPDHSDDASGKLEAGKYTFEGGCLEIAFPEENVYDFTFIDSNAGRPEPFTLQFCFKPGEICTGDFDGRTVRISSGWKEGKFFLTLRVLGAPFHLHLELIPDCERLMARLNCVGFPCGDYQLTRV
jgi:CubicO group peptidase (beta-lactamase class C family)